MTSDKLLETEVQPRRTLPGSWTAIFLAILVAYLAWFYSTPLKSLPPDTTTGRAARRADFWLYLVLPDQLAAIWFPEGDVSIVDRLPILAAAGGILVAACAAGWLTLRAIAADRGFSRLQLVLFSAAIGLNLVSLYVLLAGLVGLLRPAIFLIPATIVIASAAIVKLRSKKLSGEPIAFPPRETVELIGPKWLWLAVPFVLVYLLGGMLPPVDFDVREYHLQAPKEFFLQGRLEFLPHNVYANMPLGTEMLSLLAMVVDDDWWRGALVGKTLIALFGPLTTTALFALGVRFFSITAGVVAALVYISIPWIVQVSTNGLVEGAFAFYLTMSLFALLLWREAAQDSRTPVARSPISRSSVLAVAGFLAGAAVSCKYPAVLFVVFPFVAWILWRLFLEREGRNLTTCLRPLAIFLAAVAVGCGPWLAKNWVQTGNPTYPLLYEVFDGRTRTDEKNEQWTRVHRPPNYQVGDLLGRLVDIAVRSEWHSPILIPLAALSLLVAKRRPLVWLLISYLAFTFAAWWLFTHRIDRFWVPALPVVALMAGVGATWQSTRTWRWLLAVILLFGLVGNFLVATSGMLGDSRYFASLARLRVDPVRVDPWHLYLNFHVPPGAAILLVGDAQPFDLNAPVYYNTVFDDSIFEQLVRNRDPEEIRAALAARGISHIYVHWGEIARYRSPGNYGFTDFVQPAVFERLTERGILEPIAPLSDHPGQVFRVN